VRFEALAFRYEISYNNSKKENWVLIGSLQYISSPKSATSAAFVLYHRNILLCRDLAREEEFHRSWSYVITECVHKAEVQRLHHTMASHIHPIDVRFFLVDISIAHPPNNFVELEMRIMFVVPEKREKLKSTYLYNNTI
jgi:hypothetical protein